MQSVNNNPNGGSGDNNEQQQNIDNLTLSFLKLGTSEMGDSGMVLLLWLIKITLLLLLSRKKFIQRSCSHELLVDYF